MIDMLARLILFPLLAYQGYKLTRHAVLLPEPSGDRDGVTGTGPCLRLLVLGDSSAAGVGTLHQDTALLGQVSKSLSQRHEVHWSLVAKTGATTRDTTRRLQAMPARKIDIVSIALGVNDVTRLVPLPVWLARYGRLLDLLQVKFGADVICVSGVPKMQHFPILPQPLRWVLGAQAHRFDRHLRRLAARRPEVRFVDMDFAPNPTLMSADGYHPGPEIYAAWGNKIVAAIRADLPP